MASDILILLVSAKFFFDLVRQRAIPEILFVSGSVLIAFCLGLDIPVAKSVIREGISAVVIILYIMYFFYLKQYRAPGGELFDLYLVFATVLLGIYIMGRLIRVFWVIILAIGAAVVFGYLFR